jgi:hypothetical protein
MRAGAVEQIGVLTSNGSKSPAAKSKASLDAFMTLFPQILDPGPLMFKRRVAQGAVEIGWIRADCELSFSI